MVTFRSSIVALALAASGLGVAVAKAELQWERVATLPPSAGQAKQLGVAGPFAGVHGDALIVAGGANFPDKLPWDGGAKIWWDDVWVLEGLAGGAPRWANDKVFKLPRRIGYGVSVDTPEGVICAGGHDAERCYADVFMLSWDAKTRELRRTELPPMPEPLSFMAGALVGQTLFVAGGQTTMKNPVPASVFWALDLSKRGRPEFRWEVLPSWPGPGRVLPVAATTGRRGGAGAGDGEFFLFSGRVPEVGKPTRILSDAYAFEPRTRTWRVLPPIGDGVRSGLSVMAGTAAVGGEGEVLIFGGDRGDAFHELEAHDLAIADLRSRLGAERADVAQTIEARLAAKRKIYDAHPGFAREVLAFDPRSNTWRVAGRSPLPPQVTTVAVRQGDAVWIPTGEIKPGIRTPEIVRVKLGTKAAER